MTKKRERVLDTITGCEDVPLLYIPVRGRYAVDAMVEARAEKRTRLLNSWRQGSAEAIAGVTVRGATHELNTVHPLRDFISRFKVASNCYFRSILRPARIAERIIWKCICPICVRSR